MTYSYILTQNPLPVKSHGGCFSQLAVDDQAGRSGQGVAANLRVPVHDLVPEFDRSVISYILYSGIVYEARLAETWDMGGAAWLRLLPRK